IVDAGCPEAVRGGGVIRGLAGLSAAAASATPGGGAGGTLHVFHAGTRLEDGEWVVRGGRPAYLTARGDTLEGARASVYAARARLSGPGWRTRDDVGAHLAAPARSA